MKAAIVLFDGFDELDVIGPYEVLKNAARGTADVAIKLVTCLPTEAVTGDHDLQIKSQGGLDDSYELVIVPGGGWISGAGTGVKREIANDVLPATLRKLHSDGVTVASVCTGAMLLAAAGITKDRPATTNKGAHNDLAESGARLRTERVIDDGDLLTCGGVTAGIDLALWIVERYWGRKLADAIAGGMEFDRSSDIHVTGSAKGDD